MQVEQTKLSQKVFYHFAIFAIVNKILITKNYWKLIFNHFSLKYYQVYRKTARDKNCLVSSYRTQNFFRIFLSIF